MDDACDLASGTSHDWNGNGVLDECEPVGTAGCFGDGSTQTPCPCANTGALGRGCDNSELTGGARLDGIGDPGSDTLVLVSSGERSSAPTIFAQGSASDANGITFGDGVRCAAGTLTRLYVKVASGGVVHVPRAVIRASPRSRPSWAIRSSRLRPGALLPGLLPATRIRRSARAPRATPTTCRAC